MHVTAQVRNPERARGLEANETCCGDLTSVEWADAARHRWSWDDVVHLAGSVAVPANAGEDAFVANSQAARAHCLIAAGLNRAIPEEWSGRLVVSSSMTVYGAAERLPVVESQSLRPRFLYALGKLLAEDVWRASGRADCWLLRLPGLFSASRRSGALFHFIAAGLEGRSIELTAKEPTQWELLHVEDAAEAIARALASSTPFAGAMNVGYGESVELSRVARLVSELTSGAPIVNRTGVVHPEFQLDISRARQWLSWPPCSLHQRLQQLVEEVRASA
jgi:nucleoside-diphosphate-sugar epimerase